ncbi:MAG: hypothetical protein WBG92_15785 [Thiohalocapsa sp.]
MRVIEADACTYRPARPVDLVYFSYALTMIPDWPAAIDNALAMINTGGLLGVVASRPRRFPTETDRTPLPGV